MPKGQQKASTLEPECSVIVGDDGSSHSRAVLKAVEDGLNKHLPRLRQWHASGRQMRPAATPANLQGLADSVAATVGQGSFCVAGSRNLEFLARVERGSVVSVRCAVKGADIVVTSWRAPPGSFVPPAPEEASGPACGGLVKATGHAGVLWAHVTADAMESAVAEAFETEKDKPTSVAAASVRRALTLKLGGTWHAIYGAAMGASAAGGPRVVCELRNGLRLVLFLGEGSSASLFWRRAGATAFSRSAAKMLFALGCGGMAYYKVTQCGEGLGGVEEVCTGLNYALPFCGAFLLYGTVARRVMRRR
eukprot:TRINITY_DN14271_c0_g1_i1.p1 TRINITY_DN14271_c0_g1~~TRINITY_DN14271_c0_g1_i1.p1  ORF type:complete len:336 (+),score=23.72 TRINITY_DN14271_c0_g1_i1:92-1009(+)